jgi:hypothetical protein
MVDFSKLSRPPKTAEEREEDERRRNARDIAADAADRTKRSSKTITLTLAEDAETRFTASGSQTIQIYGSELGRAGTTRATWFAPDHFSRNESDLVLNRLLPGAELRLDGYWKPFTNSHGETHFTFIAQFIRFADGTSAP